MRANRARWPIATMARLLRVSTSGYYAWLVREPSAHACGDAQLLARIRTLHASSRGTYGAPRIHVQLARCRWRWGSAQIWRRQVDGGVANAYARDEMTGRWSWGYWSKWKGVDAGCVEGSP